MSMMTIIKKAFGFSPETEEDDEYDSTLPEYAAPAPPEDNVAASATNSNTHFTETPPQEPEQAPASTICTVDSADDVTLPDDLFDAVIALFNETQPDFIKKCLNLEAQRAYIVKSLSESLRGRINNLLSAAKWAEEKAQLEQKIESLETDTVKNLRQENHRLELSVNRQKRALLDRINDLEAQVARHDEEKEKIFSSKPGSQALAKANAHIRRLEEEKAALIADKASSAVPASGDDEVVKLHSEIENLSQQCQQLSEEADRQSTLRQQLEVKTQMSDNIINDLRNQLAECRNELEAVQSEQEAVMGQIQTQLDGFEDLKARKDAKITELQNSNASLKRTIESNLYNHVETEQKLREELNRLKSRLLDAEKDAAALLAAKTEAEAELATLKTNAESNLAAQADADTPRPARKRGRPRKVKIDADLDNTDWFSTGKDDPDFGYHEPPRRPSNNNEAQLSLF